MVCASKLQLQAVNGLKLRNILSYQLLKDVNRCSLLTAALEAANISYTMASCYFNYKLLADANVSGAALLVAAGSTAIH